MPPLTYHRAAMFAWVVALAFSPAVQDAHGPGRVDSIMFCQLMMLVDSIRRQ